MNRFGHQFRVSLFGESHGKEVGVVIDGCPPGIPLDESDFTHDLNRRKGNSPGTTSRREPDHPRPVSGLFRGKTTGAPLTILFRNRDTRSGDYEEFRNIPRPGHADLTARIKYGGFNDYRGGGHFSGRLTVGIVAAGVIARKIIQPVKVRARLTEAGGDSHPGEAVKRAVENNDSTGGIVECRAEGVPAGLGEPFFDSFESALSHIIFSIPAVKGIEFGSGFDSARMTGSENNDSILDRSGTTETNHAGGINGGITNGNEIYFRLAVKPTPSVSRPQRSVDMKTGKPAELRIRGRHDACIALRVPVIAESATAVVLADMMLRNRSYGETGQ